MRRELVMIAFLPKLEIEDKVRFERNLEF